MQKHPFYDPEANIGEFKYYKILPLDLNDLHDLLDLFSVYGIGFYDLDGHIGYSQV